MLTRREPVDLLLRRRAGAARRLARRPSPGEVTCVLGRNGVGKTSLMRAIVGQQPDRGGRDPLGRPRHRRPASPIERARARHRLRAAGPRDLPAADACEENLETGFAPLPARRARASRTRSSSCFPVLKTHAAAGAAATSPAASSSSSPSAARSSRARRLLLLDEPTEGIQPSIIKDIGRAIGYLRAKGGRPGSRNQRHRHWARAVRCTRRARSGLPTRPR